MTNPASAAAPTRTCVVLVGGESAGKSTLAAALAGVRPIADNLAGSTVAVERFASATTDYLDTPGIVHRLDTATTTLALEALATPDGADGAVLLVLRATHLDDDLGELLPTVAGRRGAIAVTHWDRVAHGGAADEAVRSIEAAVGVPLVTLDARKPGAEITTLRRQLDAPGVFTTGPVLARAGWRVEPPRTWLEHRWVGPPLGLMLLLAPAVAAVWLAVTFATAIEPTVEATLAPMADLGEALPGPLAAMVAGDYGFVTMGPLLLVWALPVVVLLALLLGVLKDSGLLDRCTTAVHPLVRPFGLTGRDLVRIVAGHGCNVPAVVSTRSCSSCTRDATIGAIAFGTACSYQLAATLGVLAAAKRPELIAPYLVVLLGGALVHARMIARASGADPVSLDLHLLRGRTFLQRPSATGVWREARTTLTHVTLRALPIFAAITVTASLLAWAGAVDAAARGLQPVLSALRLPAEAALPVALASLRKDGLLLLAEPGTVETMDAAQLLAALVLAGALVPCLVTALTIARERGRRVAARLLGRQAGGALLLTAAVSWVGLLVVRA